MVTKTISLELDAYEKLRRAKRAGESFSAVVRRAYFGPGDARGASILGASEGLAVKSADRRRVGSSRIARADRQCYPLVERG